VNALRALDRFARPAVERCALCGRAVLDEHPHVVDLERRALACACPTCARLLTTGARHRAVPDRVLVDPAFQLDDAAWDALRIPVRLAFIFFHSGLGQWVALYPSPAGAAEAALPAEPFAALAARTPLCDEAQPDVEALLVYGRRGRPLETFLAPIDACYRLVGRVRLHWRGFHGGDDAWREIEAFFTDLRARARPLEGR